MLGLVDKQPTGLSHTPTTSSTNPSSSASTMPPSLYKTNTIEEDVCFPSLPGSHVTQEIDFALLDSWIQHQDKANDTFKSGNHGFYDHDTLRTYSFHPYIDSYSQHQEPKQLYQDNYRVSFYSVAEPSTIHAKNIAELPDRDQSFSSMLKKGCFWLDVMCPTDQEMKQLSKAFHIHPLTTEDIAMEEPREKCEVFKNYCFVCFRSFDQDPTSITYLQPIGVYMLIFGQGILTFHFRPIPHAYNVRRRIKQLKDYIRVTPDWICYGLLDDITDSFAPLIRGIEFEVDSIDELVLILKESEQSDMLRRIGYCRKRVMSLLRLLVTKVDVVKTMIKRGKASSGDLTSKSTISPEVVLYLGDVQDHLITMLQSLNHYEKISSRSHSNYLAQISIEMTQTNNDINDVLSKLTALGSVVIPMNLITGLFGMNVPVPGQFTEDLTWFACITVSILTFCMTSVMMMRYYRII
ncbi:cora-domain-containing protein [Hesseltinella vesiculosa]|uniref:Cora-domain-containing protein n=1 Tax=Hesseltinella vesiculosa TaxID=101127 RepID=A0A1X2GDG3_9FUNG|nr:cora-domain-containing protein [Hesseltinella vesiculosa]